MRYVLSHAGGLSRWPTLSALATREGSKRLASTRPETYEQAYARNIERSRDELHDAAVTTSSGRVSVSSVTRRLPKSTTVTNFCGITPDLVEFISDTTPIKHGKYQSRRHIFLSSPYEEFARQAIQTTLCYSAGTTPRRSWRRSRPLGTAGGQVDCRMFRRWRCCE